MSTSLPALLDANLWTADDVARYLVVSRSWVYTAASSGRLPCRRVGALLRFEPAEIRAYVAASATAPSLRSPKK